jgi:hypothetical protein
LDLGDLVSLLEGSGQGAAAADEGEEGEKGVHAG